MAKGKITFLSSPLFWRLWLMLIVLLCLAQVWTIWLSGSNETKSAFASGRRFIVAIENGEISGKSISADAFLTGGSVEKAPDKDTQITTEVTEPPAEQAQASEAEPIKTESVVEPVIVETKPVESAPPPVVEAAEIPKLTVIAPEEEDQKFSPIAPSISAPQTMVAALIEKTDIGLLPRIGGDGAKPWKQYAKPYIHKSNKPMIAIVVTGLGPSKYITERALRLPEPIVLSFSPYTQDLQGWTSAARLAGHEFLIDLPMEPSNYPASDPGPLGLLVSKEQQENENRLKRIMASTSGYMGFLMPQDEAFSSNNELFKALLKVVSGRGLMMVVGKQPHKKDTKDILEGDTTANVIADTLIDEELTPTAIMARLTLLEQIAKERGYAIGVARAYPLTIDQLVLWSEKLEAAGFVLVPVSFIVSQRFS